MPKRRLNTLIEVILSKIFKFRRHCRATVTPKFQSLVIRSLYFLTTGPLKLWNSTLTTFLILRHSSTYDPEGEEWACRVLLGVSLLIFVLSSSSSTVYGLAKLKLSSNYKIWTLFFVWGWFYGEFYSQDQNRPSHFKVFYSPIYIEP